jgi:hypothetical protein
VNGVKQGLGTMIFDNKDKYVGQLFNNERHGEGKYYMASGDRIEGTQHQETILQSYQLLV